MSNSTKADFNSNTEKYNFIKYIHENDINKKSHKSSIKIESEMNAIIAERNASNQPEYLVQLKNTNISIWLSYSFLESSEILMNYYSAQNAKRLKQ